MSQFKFDIHVHTGEVSPCGRIKAVEVVNLYKKAGYDGLVITDHFYESYLGKMIGIDWEEKIDRFMEGYHLAYQAGIEYGISVLFGMEIKFGDDPNEYLVYGIDEDFLKENPELHHLNLLEFRKLTAAEDILIYQAHPFRDGLTRAEPFLLDGIEVYNGNARHNSRNRLAYNFARENDLNMISGSDFHKLEELAKGGIILPDKVSTSRELNHLLREDSSIELIGRESHNPSYI